MPSAHFGEKLKAAMERDVDKLLGRIFAAYPIPLTEDEITTMWNGTFEPDIQHAYHCLRRAGLPINSLISLYQEAVIARHGPYIHLRLRDAACLNTPYYMHKKVYRNRRMPEFTLETLQVSCPVDKWDAFTTWLVNRARLEAEFDEASATITQIIHMASTIGQLRRMMPDLSTYLSPEHQRLLWEQQRSSSVPHEFAAYDHDKLHRAVAVMAKCHLLADSDCLWSNRDSYTGAEFTIPKEEIL